MNVIETLINHPIHPLIVHFPIALTTTGLFFIICAFIWQRKKVLEQIAFSNISLAAISTVFAGITGYYDYVHQWQRTAPYHTTKIILASILFAITANTALVRWRKPDLFEHSIARWVYAGAYLVSFGIAAVLGYIGGIIVYG